MLHGSQSKDFQPPAVGLRRPKRTPGEPRLGAVRSGCAARAAGGAKEEVFGRAPKARVCVLVEGTIFLKRSQQRLKPHVFFGYFDAYLAGGR